MMERTPVNPWPWSLSLGYNQAEMITGVQRQLICAGQTATDETGQPRHPGDMRAQMAMTLDNLQAVLQAGGMDLGNVVKLTVYTTDVDAVFTAFDILGQRFGTFGARPPMTLLGVSRLAMPSLMVELDATAMA